MTGDLDLLSSRSIVQKAKDPCLRIGSGHLFGHMASIAAMSENHANIAEFEFVRVIESGDEVVLTYEATRADGSRFRNTEVLTFVGEKIAKAEVYFGWDLD